jgi:argininosuccinate lyase
MLPPFDWRLYAQDIQGSIAHCRMLAKRIISMRMPPAWRRPLQIKQEMTRRQGFEEDYEDIHTLVEKRLIQKVGC